MILRYAPIGRGRLAVAGLLLALAATGPIVDASGQADGKPKPAATTAPLPADEAISRRIAESIAVLRATDIKQPRRWGSAILILAEIGKPAVPPLIEELDRTTEERALRSLAFALRAIGDPRAVPALIRALPRTLVDNAGDFGLMVYDPKLHAFLRKHDVGHGKDLWGFGFGTPYREVTAALHALTGHRFDVEDQLNFVDVTGSPKQRWLKRWLFHELAGRWAVWWKQNWRRFTDDAAYARISVPPLPESPGVDAASADRPFPMGHRLRTSNSLANLIVGPPRPAEEYDRTFTDLDTGREAPWPEGLPAPSKAKGEEVAAFAEREGLDLRGIEYNAPGSARPCYAIQGLGLRAWQIDNQRFGTIEEELRAGHPPTLDRPAGDLLMDRDPRTGLYHPENKATFLFVTREGSTGVLQLNGLVTELDAPGVPFMAPFPDPPEEVGKPAPLRSIRGAYRGVQFHYKFFYTEEDAAR